MKNIVLFLMSLGLVGCGALDVNGSCYFAEVPAKYRWDQGKLVIDPTTRKPIVNPHYLQYLKCYPEYEKQPPVTVLGTVQQYLKDSYQVLGKTYRLSGQREFKPGAAYIASNFVTTDNNSAIKQEIFFYNGSQPFLKRFLTDINKNEGHFEKKTSEGIEYIQGKSHAGEQMIYLVKPLDQQNISIVLYIAKQPILNSTVVQLVKDLNLI